VSRIVITGAPGAGKTTLLLALRLVATRSSGIPLVSSFKIGEDAD